MTRNEATCYIDPGRQAGARGGAGPGRGPRQSSQAGPQSAGGRRGGAGPALVRGGKQWPGTLLCICAAQIVAEELYRAEVQVVPRPAEFNISRVARDPRRGRYRKEPTQPHGKLCRSGGSCNYLKKLKKNLKPCRDIRRQLIDEIIKKHKMVGGRAATDGEKRKRRKRYEVKQRIIQKKKRIRKVVSTKVKKKKLPTVSACPECGDFHVKKSDVCRVLDCIVYRYLSLHCTVRCRRCGN